ncbi:MAG: G5 domain-containing protein [Candidatus Fermentithermobacillus carboniphilus]|uniref:G5 domain-containing protein n=1 Tax=Candidatus Fermentithermobacillus carboniphilus TaxID=3085328 RepID=A0AAT9L9U2_9FIRM|nr:MAG: G5 domain-containing protein [Candidatus Fermentithermobacillus carboniphilus]
MQNWRFSQLDKTPFIKYVPLAVVLLAVGSCAGLVVTNSRQNVVISAPDREVYLTIRPSTVKDVLNQAEISLGPGDSVYPSLDTQTKDGMRITVERAKPVFVISGDRISTVFTSERNVGKVLELAKVSLAAEDKVVPGIDQEVPPDGTIRVVKVTYGEVTVDEKLPFDTEKREDSSLEAGLVRVYREGTPGIVRVTYTVKYEDGKEVSRQEKSRVKVKDPTPRILLVGTKREVSRGGQNIRFERALEVMATAYCPCSKCCGPYANGYTHTGVPAKRGVIAVDPKVIPLGTRVYVDGYGFGVAADTGSAIKGQRIDVCFDTHEEALAWGKRKVKVFILR